MFARMRFVLPLLLLAGCTDTRSLKSEIETLRLEGEQLRAERETLRGDQQLLRKVAARRGLGLTRAKVCGLFPKAQWKTNEEKGLTTGVVGPGSIVHVWGTEQRVDAVHLIGAAGSEAKAFAALSLFRRVFPEWKEDEALAWYAKAVAASSNELNVSCNRNGVQVLVICLPISDPPVYSVSFAMDEPYSVLPDHLNSEAVRESTTLEKNSH